MDPVCVNYRDGDYKFSSRNFNVFESSNYIITYLYYSYNKTSEMN